MGNRLFKCVKCYHEFEVPYCSGEKGYEIKCPQCSSRAVRINKNTQSAQTFPFGRRRGRGYLQGNRGCRRFGA